MISVISPRLPPTRISAKTSRASKPHSPTVDGPVPKLLLDTSVLIEGSIPPGHDAAISAVTIAELHFGLLVARDSTERASRSRRLGLVEARFPDPLPVDDLVAPEWGGLQAKVAERGGKPRYRSSDLAIAATAIVHGAALMTHDIGDFKLIKDLVEIVPAG